MFTATHNWESTFLRPIRFPERHLICPKLKHLLYISWASFLLVYSWIVISVVAIASIFIQNQRLEGIFGPIISWFGTLIVKTNITLISSFLVNTKVDLRFHVLSAEWIPEDVRHKILEKVWLWKSLVKSKTVC